MAFAVIGRRPEQTENINEKPGEIIDYACDDASDVASLPVYPEIRMGSTAFIINTSEVQMLGSGGWRVI
jgi:hypothetical protein